MAETLTLLIAFNFLFFWKVWSNPFWVARSELLSTFFPSWLHIGRQIRQSRSWKYEPCYWLNFHAHPVLSSYYPPHVLSAWIGAFLDLDTAFVLLTRTILVHFILASVGWYFLFSVFYGPWIALFGAITLTYSGYTIKQQPCIIYTIAWFPWILFGLATHNPWLAGSALGLNLLAGYYPIGMQVLLISFLASVVWLSTILWIPIGFFIALPQLIPFLKYLPKTIRANQHDEIGKVPWWHFFSLFFPDLFLRNINGVGFWEFAYYVGIIPLALCSFHASGGWLAFGIVSLFLMMGGFSRFLPRIPARWAFSFQLCLGWVAVNTLATLGNPKIVILMAFIQGFDLCWRNSRLIPTFPYSELPKRPSWAFKTKLTTFLEQKKGDFRVSGLPYPLFTGIVNRIKTLGYSGGMQLKLMSSWRNDENPNGSGEHDWFKTKGDSERLDTTRVLYAYTRKRIDWENTPIRNLYKNPRIQSG